MKRWSRRSALASWLAAIFPLAGYGAGQAGGARDNPEREEVRLPSGKLQRDEILKAEHAQNVKEAAQLVELASQLQKEIEKSDRNVLSIAILKKTDDIEKLVRKIRSRLRH